MRVDEDKLKNLKKAVNIVEIVGKSISLNLLMYPPMNKANRSGIVKVDTPKSML